MRLPVFTFDIRESSAFTEAFDPLEIAEQGFAFNSQQGRLSAADYEHWIAPYINDNAILEGLCNVLAGIEEPTDDAEALVEEIHMAFQDAAQYWFEDCFSPDADDISRALELAVDEVRGTEMMGVNTNFYWCGALASWPWEEVCTDEYAVTSTVLDKAKILKDGRLQLTYAGTPWSPALLRVAKAEGDDPGFGGNSEMELGVMARYIFKAAVERLTNWAASTVDSGAGIDRWMTKQLNEVFELVNA